jgi:hypothetical protein
VGRRVSPKRLILTLLAAIAASVVLVPSASAGDFDPARMNCTGDDPATCPTGQVGEPYSLAVRLVGDEDTGCAVLRVSSGSLPFGLSITQQFNETKSAIVSGTPTAAGSYSFFLTVDYNAAPGCAKSSSDNGFIININPEVPRLILQPEQAGVPSSTVGAPYSLQMTSNLPDAKTWAISSGALPTGLTLDANTGLISGTPSAAGTFSFTVGATLTNDTQKSPPRSDTKALTITVRNALTITGPVGARSTAMPPSEVGVPFEAPFTVAGGNETYGAWTLASGALPGGLTLGTDGTISGTPRAAGRFPFSISITDTEAPTPRTATYTGVIVVAAKLDVVTQRVRPGKVGKLYRAKLVSTGGVKPTVWKVTKGPLPRGVKLDRKTGVLSGKPRKAGRFAITVEVTDELGVKSAQRLVILVAPAAKAKNK